MPLFSGLRNAACYAPVQIKNTQQVWTGNAHGWIPQCRNWAIFGLQCMPHVADTQMFLASLNACWGLPRPPRPCQGWSVHRNEWMNDGTRLHASAQTSSQSAIFAADVLLLQRVISCRKISTLQFFIVVNTENNKYKSHFYQATTNWYAQQKHSYTRDILMYV